jgi:hypothetical protein
MQSYPQLRKNRKNINEWFYLLGKVVLVSVK